MFNLRRGLFSMILAFALGGVLVVACHHHRGDGDPHKMAAHIVNMMQKNLDLTVDQTVQVQKLANEIADTLQARQDTAEDRHHMELVKQLRSLTVDTAALNAEFARHAEKMLAHREFFVGKFVQLHAILTPEQRGKLADFLEKHHGEFMPWGPGGMKHRHPQADEEK